MDDLGLLSIITLAAPLMSLLCWFPSLLIPCLPLPLFCLPCGEVSFSNFLREAEWRELVILCLLHHLTVLPSLLALRSWRLTSIDCHPGYIPPGGDWPKEAAAGRGRGGETWRIAEDYQRLQQVVMTITIAVFMCCFTDKSAQPLAPSAL